MNGYDGITSSWLLYYSALQNTYKKLAHKVQYGYYPALTAPINTSTSIEILIVNQPTENDMKVKQNIKRSSR